jgi:hypothetical protein
MEVVKRRVYLIRDGKVGYEDVSCPQLVIYRTVEEHKKATGTDPSLGQIVLFDTWYDYCDGSFSSYHGAV